jgi:hypothetical protein
MTAVGRQTLSSWSRVRLAALASAVGCLEVRGTVWKKASPSGPQPPKPPEPLFRLSVPTPLIPSLFLPPDIVTMPMQVGLAVLSKCHGTTGSVYYRRLPIGHPRQPVRLWI